MSRDERQHWENRYRHGDAPWDTGRPSPELIHTVAEAEIAPCRAIELGCGTGTNAVWLAQHGFDVTAIDISSLAIERARQRAADAGVTVRFLAADLLTDELAESPFDFLFDRGCWHAVRRVDADGILRVIDALTAPGCRGLVLTGNAKEAKKPGPPAVSEETIRAELGRVLEIERLREFRFDQEEADGSRHLGWSVLLRKPAVRGVREG